MYNTQMINFGESRSVIRELAAYGAELAPKIGKENVFDFTIGNPSVPTPDAVNKAICYRVKNDTTIHGYTPAQGLLHVREKIADFNKKTYRLPISANNIYLTCGAAAALAITLRAVVTPEQNEIVVITPFFPEYKVFAANAGAQTVVVPMDEENFQINFDALEKALSPRTAAVIVNTPNNPSGIVYSAKTLQTLAETLTSAEKRFGNVIVLVSDEPYREIVFDVPFSSPLAYYDNAVLCYSYSKTYSLPGERIGYVAISDNATQCDQLRKAVLGAGRALGYICAPSLFQQVIADCIGHPSDTNPYRENRDILVKELTSLGYKVVNPQGAFYLLMKVPSSHGNFVELAKQHGILLVPTDSFGLTGYVRIATCVTKEMILRSLPVFKTVTQKYFQK